MNVPWGAQLDFASLGYLQVTISHFPVPVPDYCPDVPDLGSPTIGPAHTPASAWL